MARRQPTKAITIEVARQTLQPPKEVIEPYLLSSLRNDCTLRDPGMIRRCLHKVLVCLHLGYQCTQTFLQVSKNGISQHKLAHFLGNLFYKLPHFLGESFHKLAHFLVKHLHSWYTIVNRKEVIL